MHARTSSFIALVLFACLTRHANAADAPPPAALKLECTEYEWKRGDAPIKMIKKDEGICYLSRVAGHFSGSGESIGVYVGEDGYWYLSGAAREDVSGSAIAVRFPVKMEVNISRAPTATALAELAALSKSTNADVVKAAEEELKDSHVDAERQFVLAQQWLTLAKTDASALQVTMEAHAIDLIYSSANGLPEENLAAKARAQANELAVAFCQKHLNELSQWNIQRGNWDTNADGKLRGSDDSSLQFRFPLPADCEISFHLTVVDGMRPRVYFGGTDLMLGNEGYEKVLEMHGAQLQHGVKFPYKLDQDIPITVKFSEPNFELYIDGKLMSKGSRKKVPDMMELKISAGDDWSRGACLYWGFDLKVPKAAEKKP